MTFSVIHDSLKLLYLLLSQSIHPFSQFIPTNISSDPISSTISEGSFLGSATTKAQRQQENSQREREQCPLSQLIISLLVVKQKGGNENTLAHSNTWPFAGLALLPNSLLPNSLLLSKNH